MVQTDSRFAVVWGPNRNVGPLFVNKHGKRLSSRSVRRKLDKYLKNAGLDTDIIVTPPDAPSETEDPVDGVFEEALTHRELEVLELLAEGLPNKGIAQRLGISDQTVKFHIAYIMGKLGASNRVETVRRAVRRGLLSL